MKRLLKLTLFLLTAYLLYRLLDVYLRRAPHETVTSPSPPPPSPTRLNLNTADSAALQTLPGIGPTLAGRIVAYRQEHGPFAALDDLLNVKGAGPALIERIRPLVTPGKS